MKPDDVLIPNTLDEMLTKALKPLQTYQNKSWVDYTSGWLKGATEREYRYLAVREHAKGNDDQQTVRLLCELAIARAIIQWHEVKDSPPPMPQIGNIDGLI